MMKYQILIVFIFLNKLLGAQINITVLNSKLRPIEKASIFCETLLVGQTNKEGFCSLQHVGCKYFKINCVGFKSKNMDINLGKDIYTIILEDSNYMLNELTIKERKTENIDIGSKLTNNYRWHYRIGVEGLIGSKIPIKNADFKIDEINFFVVDYKLPDSASFVDVRVCSCPTTNDTLNRKHYLISKTVKLNKKKSWYKIKYSLQEQSFINTNCIYVEFDLVYHPGIEDYLKNSIELQRNNYVVFGLDNKTNKIISYVYSGTLLPNSGYTFRPEWHTIHSPQKLMMKIIALKSLN